MAETNVCNAKLDVHTPQNLINNFSLQKNHVLQTELDERVQSVGDGILLDKTNETTRHQTESLKEKAKHYNPYLEIHSLHEKTDLISRNSLNTLVDEAYSHKDRSDDYVNLIALLTKAHTSGSKKIDLSAEKDLIERVRNVSGKILLDKNCTWDSPEAMKAQTESLREKVSEGNLKINETIMKISQGKKDMSEITEIVSKIQREHSELMKKIASMMCK